MKKKQNALAYFHTHTHTHTQRDKINKKVHSFNLVGTNIHRRTLTQKAVSPQGRGYPVSKSRESYVDTHADADSDPTLIRM